MTLPFLASRVIVSAPECISRSKNARHLPERHGVAKPSDKRRDRGRPVRLLSWVAQHFDRLKLDFAPAVVRFDDCAAILDALRLGRLSDGAANGPQNRLVADRVDLRRGNGCIRWR